MKKLTTLILIALFIFAGCSLNEYAVKKSIQAGANIGIIAWDFSDEMPANITYIVARNFLAEGYSVKAINTIKSRLTYPFLTTLFESDMELKFKTKIDSLLEHTTDITTPFAKEAQIKKELEEVKGIVGMDYLVVLYKVDRTYALVGIDIGNYELVYVQNYKYTPVPVISHIIAFFTPYYSDRKLNSVIKKFISTIQEVGSMEDYSPW